MIYLDYASSTPVDEDVLQNFYEVTKKYYANPNSLHTLGQEANDLIKNSTNNIAKLLNCKNEEIIYTSGASEANNLVIKGICESYKTHGKHIIISTLEHSSIVAPVNFLQSFGFDVDIIDINEKGIIDIDELKKLIREDTILVSICSVDSEIGLIQPIEEIANELKNYPNCFFHTDASQAICKTSIDYSNVDLITFAPHKFYGMNGVGVLIKKEHVKLTPLVHGGKSTTIYRSGTPVIAFITSLEVALNKILNNNHLEYIKKLNNLVREKLKCYDKVHINSNLNSILHTINFSIKGVDSTSFAKKLSDNGIYISTKTTCSNSTSPSKAVYALTKDKELATSSFRLSLSHMTKIEEIEEFFEIFDKCYKEVI